ncbi:hypothetical protein [Aestuariivita sp.]|jgi:hypothetical protein|uniref:hypothetical protein n=1 Tax=Aestuariivita sp. TaxID=1872407 RepID=UPI002171B2B8|nr:hypothetical protein [Aestuariivita sp.]MCE8006007.1 hypothetical protein [Aestuariivita sp.]
MNTSIIINDTHAAVQRLQQKGASADLAAEIVATVQAARVEGDLATRADINEVRTDLVELRAEMYRAFVIHGFTTVGAILAAAFGVASLLG